MSSDNKDEQGLQGECSVLSVCSYENTKVFSRQSTLAPPIKLHFTLPRGEHFLRFGCQVNTPEELVFDFGAALPPACRVKLTIEAANKQRTTSCRLKRLGTSKFLQLDLNDVVFNGEEHVHVLFEFETVFMQHIPINISDCSLVALTRGKN